MTETPALLPERLEYNDHGRIYGVQPDGRRHMFADIRGWGWLTGGAANALDLNTATAIQDEWARRVCELWNNQPEKSP